MDKIAKFLAYNGKINIICATTTELVEKAREVHDLSPVATAALGRTLTMASIMGSNLKSETDVITLQIKGNGPLNGIVVTTDNKLRTRGYVGEPQLDMPLNENGKLDVGNAVGHEGFLYVIKDIGLKEPYVGMSKLTTGEIAEDFANYFLISEQKNTAVALGVLVGQNGVKTAGGYIVTAMPDATEDELFILENRLKEAKPISQMLNENMTLEEIAKDITGDVNLQTIEENLQPKFECTCSKEKMADALSKIGKKELSEIIKEDKKAQIVCHFCNKEYNFSETELKDIIKDM